MTLPYDSCRLFYHLRNTAYGDGGDQEPRDGSPCGLIDLDREINRLGALGVSREDARLAVDDLVDAELVHRLTPDEEKDWGLDDGSNGHNVLFVEPLDDLTAATILFARSS
ncbi:MAG: hypothetical protein ACYSTY_08060 [Planctomycetota bacterium]|jgi:hypothetical protein